MCPETRVSFLMRGVGSSLQVTQEKVGGFHCEGCSDTAHSVTGQLSWKHLLTALTRETHTQPRSPKLRQTAGSFRRREEFTLPAGDGSTPPKRLLVLPKAAKGCRGTGAAVDPQSFLLPRSQNVGQTAPFHKKRIFDARRITSASG